MVRAAFESAVKSAYIIKNKNYISYYHICLARLRGYKTIKNELEKLKELNPDDFTIKSASTLKLINDKELKHRERYVEEASKFNTSDNTSDAHLEGKCKILGGLWNLYYISVYRLLSQTIHGDVHNKKSSDFHFVGGKVKAIYQYKTISVLSNWNAIAELYMHTICKQHSAMHLLDEYFIRKELYENKVDEFIKNSQVNIRRGA